MTNHKIGFTSERLRRGAILGTIAHAIWVARRPTLAAAQGWDGRNYLLNDSSGTIGTVTFGERDVVAFFFDSKSDRSPFPHDDPYIIDRYVQGMPADLVSVANGETLKFMLQEYQGAEVPVVTASFWSDGEDLVAAEPWGDVRENGGHIVQIQMMDDESALVEWQNELGLSAEQIELARALYQRKMAATDSRLSLTSADKLVLAPTRGEDECRRILASIGVDL